ncbi:hypothetical protein HDU98_001627 [Podochytrium sp. JEL0797]|nr:hypothetical protein HDU98_001627 [Podochytrium sp. JEL0797]
MKAFTLEKALQKVKGAQALWNTRNAETVAKAYTPDCVWRNRDQFFRGHDQIVKFLQDKWANENGYRLRKELFAFQDNRIAVQFWYEWHDEKMNWYRCYGLEDWTFDMEQNKMKKRMMSGNDVAIKEEERWFTDKVADVDSVKIGEEHCTPPAPALREASVAMATNFLLDPSVASAPLAKRVAFLESKGVSGDEIKAAMQRVGAGPSSAPPLPPLPIQYQQVQPQRDWRDVSLALIGAAGFGFGVWHLAQTYILPHIEWPFKNALEDQITEISTALASATATIQSQTEALQQLLESTKQDQERSAEEIRVVREDLDSLKDMLPDLVKQQQGDVSVKDLQAELKSLKNILLNRKAFPPVPVAAPIPPPLAYQSSSSASASPAANSTSPAKLSMAMTDSIDSSSSVDAFLGKFTTGKSAIPSWQLNAPAPVVPSLVPSSMPSIPSYSAAASAGLVDGRVNGVNGRNASKSPSPSRGNKSPSPSRGRKSPSVDLDGRKSPSVTASLTEVPKSPSIGGSGSGYVVQGQSENEEDEID